MSRFSYSISCLHVEKSEINYNESIDNSWNKCTYLSRLNIANYNVLNKFDKIYYNHMSKIHIFFFS